MKRMSSTKPKYYHSTASATIPPFLSQHEDEEEFDNEDTDDNVRRQYEAESSYKTPKYAKRNTTASMAVHSGEIDFSMNTPNSQNVALELSPIEHQYQQRNGGDNGYEANSYGINNEVKSAKRTPQNILYRRTPPKSDDRKMRGSPQIGPKIINTSPVKSQQPVRSDLKKPNFFDKFGVEKIDLSRSSEKSRPVEVSSKPPANSYTNKVEIDAYLEREGLELVKQQQRETEYRERDRKLREIQQRREIQRIELQEREKRLAENRIREQVKREIEEKEFQKEQELRDQERKLEQKRKEIERREKEMLEMLQNREGQSYSLEKDDIQQELQRIKRQRKERGTADLKSRDAIIDEELRNIIERRKERTDAIDTLLNPNNKFAKDDKEQEILEQFLSEVSKQDYVPVTSSPSRLPTSYTYEPEKPLYSRDLLAENRSPYPTSSPTYAPTTTLSANYRSTPDISSITPSYVPYVDTSRFGGDKEIDIFESDEISAFLKSLSPEKATMTNATDVSNALIQTVQTSDHETQTTPRTPTSQPPAQPFPQKQPVQFNQQPSPQREELSSKELFIEKLVRRSPIGNKSNASTSPNKLKIVLQPQTKPFPLRRRIEDEMDLTDEQTNVQQVSPWRLTNERSELFRAQNLLSRETLEILEEREQTEDYDETTDQTATSGFHRNQTPLTPLTPLPPKDEQRQPEPVYPSSPSMRQLKNNSSSYSIEKPSVPVEQLEIAEPAKLKGKSMKRLLDKRILIADPTAENGQRNGLKLNMQGNYLAALRKVEGASRLLKKEEEVFRVLDEGGTFYKCTPSTVVTKTHLRYFFAARTQGTLVWCMSSGKKSKAATTPTSTRTITFKSIDSISCFELSPELAVALGTKSKLSNKVLYGIVLGSSERDVEIIMDTDYETALKWLVGLCILTQRATESGTRPGTPSH